MLAIVIPYYKLTFFKETLISLANQSDKRFKVYIGNDFSSENPETLLEEFKSAFDFEYHFFENNLGSISLTDQWERCIQMTKNEDWLMVLGDDDYLAENLVEVFYKNVALLEAERVNTVRFSTYVVNDTNAIISGKHESTNKIEAVKSFLFRNNRSSLSEYIFKLDKVKLIKFKKLPLGWYSDFLAVLEFSEFGKILNISESSVYVRISDISITGQTVNYGKKNRAKFEFYHYLFKNCSAKFDAVEKNKLFSYWEKAFFNNRSNFYFWFIITSYHMKQFNFKKSIDFQIGILKSLI